MDRELPTGQRVAQLERFGLPEFARRLAAVPERPVLTVQGAVRRPAQFDLAELLDGLPEHEQRSDLHCVTTWSALDLHWSGFRFRDLAARIADAVHPHPRATWLMATGLDGFRSCLALEDACADRVLAATRLNGAELPPEHGAPLRLVSADQYGYKSVKHLVALEYRLTYSAGSAGFKEHPRARVAREERSRYLPGPLWRRIWAAALPLARKPYRS
ncbi:molybdopterin-dependent oxidoreductase [Saccharopolyspora flava]|uniref:Oxidoreductase molybdopterin binding domain-containing protein n=1 Tax=Saccharopolyspora flava TaxID=95161 RepID=A0A1I6QQZ5_9PSEU|nr:molybdopterin-dependent oxidoreductase [Saccharopolyspora flava]SFS54897.1 Oxidoreductase molybdopterin binding domain-containing protein [Saccharopolyspora flava]